MVHVGPDVGLVEVREPPDCEQASRPNAPHGERHQAHERPPLEQVEFHPLGQEPTERLGRDLPVEEQQPLPTLVHHRPPLGPPGEGHAVGVGDVGGVRGHRSRLAAGRRPDLQIVAFEAWLREESARCPGPMRRGYCFCTRKRAGFDVTPIRNMTSVDHTNGTWIFVIRYSQNVCGGGRPTALGSFRTCQSTLDCRSRARRDDRGMLT